MRLRPRKPPPARAIGYVRCSTSKQDLSPAAQAAALDAWAEREGAELLAVYFDLGVSGAKGVSERPGMLAAFAALSRGMVLVAAKLDRFSRDTYVMGSIDQEAKKAKARVVTADGTTDDELRRDFYILMSAHERRLIKQRTRDALAVKKARGERTGGIPYGSQMAADGVHLEPNAQEQKVIARIVELSDQDLTVRAIAERLAAEGLMGRNGKPMFFTQVHRLLKPILEAREVA